MTIQYLRCKVLDMDIQATPEQPIVRPKRKRRRISEPHDNYSFYLPVALMERFRRVVERERSNDSNEAEQAIRIYLATKIQLPDMDGTNGQER